MKKVLLSIGFLVSIITVKSQDINSSLSKGKWIIETSLSPFSLINTSGFSFKHNKDNSEWTAGGEAGYFLQDKWVLKAGLGFYGYKNQLTETGSITESALSYKIGSKYYFKSIIPIQIDFGGITTSENNALILGGQVGYAWFVKENIAIEPAIRYDCGLDDENIRTISARIGFSFHF